LYVFFPEYILLHLSFCLDGVHHFWMDVEGYYDMPNSYTKFLVDNLTGLDVSQKLVDIFAVLFLAMALLASVFTNVRDWRKRKK